MAPSRLLSYLFFSISEEYDSYSFFLFVNNNFYQPHPNFEKILECLQNGSSGMSSNVALGQIGEGDYK